MNNLLKLENKYRQIFLKLREERDRLDKQVTAAHTKLQKVKRVLYKNGFKGNIMRDDEGNRINTLPKTELKLCPWCGSDIGGCADEACPQESESESILPQLVRYNLKHAYSETVYPKMETDPDGKYVLYEQTYESIEILKNLSALQSETIELLEKDNEEERKRSAAARQLWADAQAKAKHWKANHDNMAQRNTVLTIRAEAAEADNKQLREAMKTLIDRISYYASLARDGVPNIEDWAYTDNSGDIAKAREILERTASCQK